jgi:choline-sulfatase
MGRFQQTLIAGGWWDRSLVVLLSDHGESLGEHGESSHGYFSYQSTLWVPLMFHWPRETAGTRPSYPARVERPGGLIDVAPTILQFLGTPKPPSFVGENLLAEGAGRPVFSESVYARDAFRWAPLHSLRAGPYQFIDAPRPELYDLRKDAAERNNVIGGNAQESARLRADLESLVARASSTRPESANLPRNALESLGYLGAGGRGTNGPAPDPKDRLPEYNLFEKAMSLMYGGRSAEATADFRKVTAQDPANTMARYYLGELYLRSDHPENAISEWTAAVSRDPQYEPAYEMLGTVWLERHDYDRARTYFLQAVTLAPSNAEAARGAAIAEEHLGMNEQAREHWRKACGLEPELAECRSKEAH